MQVILNGNATSKLGGSRRADLTATDACEAMHPPKPKKKLNKQVEKKTEAILAGSVQEQKPSLEPQTLMSLEEF